MEKMIKIGSTEIKEGTNWEECGKTEVVQILVSHGENTINAIQFVFEVDGETHLSELYGDREHALNFNTVTFNYPDECLTSISGTIVNGLCSIAFGTNKGKYGPFGGGSRSFGNKFNYEFESSCFGGFYGSTYDSHVYDIGVFIKPVDY